MPSSHDSRDILLAISHCPEIPAARGSANHPCRAIVTSQSDRSPFQLPEPWTGDIGAAQILFVSSNPSISDKEPYPTAEWGNADVGDFFENRFGEGPQQIKDGVYPPRLEPAGTHSTEMVKFWSTCKGNVKWLLGRKPIPGTDYAFTEVVHCKSPREVGVRDAAPTCTKRWLGQVLDLSGASVIVVLGSVAKTAFESETSVSLTMWDPAEVVLAGRTRLVVAVPHPNARVRRKWSEQFTEQSHTKLREALNTESP